MARKKKDLTFDLNNFSSHFRGESDRACAVLGAALLDSRLEGLYRRRLRDLADELLSSGPLGPFSARIKLAHALAWIGELVYRDLETIRSIRNDFAHDFDHGLSFADASIEGRCNNLRVAQVVAEAHEYAATQGHPTYGAAAIRAMGSSMYGTPRKRFETTVEMIAQHLDQIPGDGSPYSGLDLEQDLWTLASFGHARPV